MSDLIASINQGQDVNDYIYISKDIHGQIYIILGGSRTSTICCSTPRNENEEKWAIASSNGHCFSSTYELRFIINWVSSSPSSIFFVCTARISLFKVVNQGCELSTSTKPSLNNFLIGIRKIKEEGAKDLCSSRERRSPTHFIWNRELGGKFTNQVLRFVFGARI